MRIAELWRYPVKSLGGERAARVRVGERGVAGDRAFALVDLETRLVASAKNPRRWPNLFDLRARYRAEPNGAFESGVATVTLPGGAEVATDDPRFDEVLSATVGRAVMLSITPPEDARAESFEPDIEGVPSDAPGSVGRFRLATRSPAGTFFDSSPIHVLTTSTLRALANAEPGSRFDPRRFRPNIVLDCDDEGFVENDWVGATLAIGDEVEIEITRNTGRCVMITLPQEDLDRDPAILRACAQANAIAKDPGAAPSPCAGVYGVVRRAGEIAEGDTAAIR